MYIKSSIDIPSQPPWDLKMPEMVKYHKTKIHMYLTVDILKGPI